MGLSIDFLTSSTEVASCNRQAANDVHMVIVPAAHKINMFESPSRASGWESDLASYLQTKKSWIVNNHNDILTSIFTICMLAQDGPSVFPCYPSPSCQVQPTAITPPPTRCVSFQPRFIWMWLHLGTPREPPQQEPQQEPAQGPWCRSPVAEAISHLKDMDSL
jgi:hypothetical protein